MAKLYIEATSDKGGRVVGKGGTTFVSANITHGGRPLWEIKAGEHGLLLITCKGKTKKYNSLNW